MSIRESRLCDDTTVTGGQCSLPSAITCSLCTQDRCTTHMGTAEIKIGVELRSSDRASPVTLGYTRIHVCRVCAGKLPDDDVNIAPLTEPGCALLAAYVTARALAPKDPK